jgi:hypothetical protein
LAALLSCAASAFADDDWLPQLLVRPREALLPADLLWRPTTETSAGSLRNRVRAFCTPCGCTSDICVRTDAEAEASLDPALRAGKDVDDILDTRVAMVVVNDNPFFDFRRPGDLGGVGYQRLYSEVELLGTGRGSVALVCHAATPAGRENDGVDGGPTQFSPAVTWLQDLGDGLAIQGFVGKTMRARFRDVDTAPRNLEYGMVVQHPLPVPGVDTDTSARVYLFVETLGRYRFEDSPSGAPPGARWDVLPGIHLQAGENWWLSGGVMFPLGPSRYEGGLWQVTCAWQF